MDEEKFREILRSIAYQEVKEDLNRWPEIQARIVQESSQPRPRRVKRVGRLLLVAVLVLLVSAAAYGFYQSSRMPSGIEGAQAAQLVTPLGLSQTVDGVTVTLNWAYADGNKIAFEYDTFFTDDTGKIYTPSSDTPVTIRLMTRGGQILRSSQWRSTQDTTTRPVRLEFSIPPLLTQEVDLIVELVFNERPKVRTFLDDLLGVRRNGNALTMGSLPAPESTAEVQPLPVTEGGVGPFRFEVTLKVLPSIIAEPMQTVTVAGIPITLEYVSFSPTQTEVRICYAYDKEMRRLAMVPKSALIIDETVIEAGGMASVSRPRYCMRHTFDVFIENYPETLIFRVDAFEAMPASDGMLALAQAIGDDAILKVEPNADGSGYSISRTEDEAAYQQALIEAGYRIEGPWTFEINLPSREE